MSTNLHHLTLFITIFTLPHSLLGLSNPDPAAIQQPFLPNQSPPATIPAYPEQSDLTTCPLSLPDELFHAVKSACSSKNFNELHRSRCCPVLAAWFHAAYAATALSHAGSTRYPRNHNTYDMPLLPDDSETCVDGMGKALKERGVQLARPNETCDLMYCFCGIRLHPLSCPGAFSLNEGGKLVGDESVKRLEKSCLSQSDNNNGNGFPGLGGCSKCLHSLQLLDEKKSSNSSKAQDRTARMHKKDCQLMGVTWLLAKNRTAYIHTVTSVLRAIMMNPDGSNPRSCTLNSDGKPLAVDSYEISDQSSSSQLQGSILTSLVITCILYMHLAMSFTRFS